jgi:hypothetical protein
MGKRRQLYLPGFAPPKRVPEPARPNRTKYPFVATINGKNYLVTREGVTGLASVAPKE